MINNEKNFIIYISVILFMCYSCHFYILPERVPHRPVNKICYDDLYEDGTFYETDDYTYYYYNNGNLKRIQNTFADTILEDYYMCEYNEYNFLTGVYHYHKDNSLMEYIYLLYNEKDYIKRIEEYNSNSEMTHYLLYFYHASGKIKSRDYYYIIDDTAEYSTTEYFYYDTFNRLILITRGKKDEDQIVARKEFKYTSWGALESEIDYLYSYKMYEFRYYYDENLFLCYIEHHRGDNIKISVEEITCEQTEKQFDFYFWKELLKI